MRKADEKLNKDEIDCCKEELKNYIEFVETAGDNAGWARDLEWYVDKLEKQLADSTPNSVIREKINERQFELQQEYSDLKNDIVIKTLQDIYYEKGEK